MTCLSVKSHGIILHCGVESTHRSNFSSCMEERIDYLKPKYFIEDDFIKERKLGDGTHGEITKATQKSKGDRKVALKRMLPNDHEEEGVSIHTLCEIKFLTALKHKNIIALLDITTHKKRSKVFSSEYLVLELMDFDLHWVIKTQQSFIHAQVKYYMQQIIQGVQFCHANQIIHCDLKPHNILLRNDGSVKITDFGLATGYIGNRPARSVTVITSWYRPPELYLGERVLEFSIDVWSLGCIFGELLKGVPFLPGTAEDKQLDCIWSVCGTPDHQADWPEVAALPRWSKLRPKTHQKRALTEHLHKSVHFTRRKGWYGAETMSLLDELLALNPKKRINLCRALMHPYFRTEPLPLEQKDVPKYTKH